MGVYKREVQEYGIKPVQIFPLKKNIKNAADIELCVEVLEVAHDVPWVDVFVIVTGDGGFVPLIRRLHSLNKYVAVVSITAPNAGLINPLLKSVADEYHQIDVQGAPCAPGAVQPAPVAVQPPVPPAPLVMKKLPPGPPELAVLRKFILDIVKTQPQLSKKGQADAAALSRLLRKKWPGLKCTPYQSTNLSSFVEKYCGLVAHRPVPKKAKPAVNLPVKAPVLSPRPAAALTVTNREEYMATVPELFTAVELGRLVRDKRTAGLPLAQVSTQVRTVIDGFTSADSGFSKFHVALQQALGGTDFRVVRTGEKMMAVVHLYHVDQAEILPAAAAVGLVAQGRS